MIQRSNKRVGRLIGPFPYKPKLLFLFFFAFLFSRFLPLIAATPPGFQRLQAFLGVFCFTLIPSLLISLTSKFLIRYRPWSSIALFPYLCEVVAGNILLNLYLRFADQSIFHDLIKSYPIVLSQSLGSFIISIIITLTVLSFMHRSEKEIMDRLNAAENLTEKLQEARERIIFSDEELRQQTASFLHDRVQSDLMVAALKLKSLESLKSDTDGPILKEVIKRLETLRAADLRNLVQILTPNFEGVGLGGALTTLTDHYAAEMSIVITMEEAIEPLGKKLHLGIYRIVEQALLNSLAHGPARNVQIEIKVLHKNKVTLEVRDDGPGCTDLNPGVGSTIIDSWVSISHGSKEIITSPGAGYTLRVSLNI